MRYGIIVEGARLPSADIQHGLLESCDCDVILQEPSLTIDARRRLSRLVSRLRAGDELIVQSLDIFGYTTGELAQMLRDLIKAGVTLSLARSPDDVLRLQPDPATRLVLEVLADHEARQSPTQRASKRRRGEDGRHLHLTVHQIEYARKLHAEGASLRAIGLIFQVSPADIREVIDR